jgi:hypothetical protein
MAANRPKRRKLICTPKGSYGYICEEFNILTAGPNLRQWAPPLKIKRGFLPDSPLLGCVKERVSWTDRSMRVREDTR